MKIGKGQTSFRILGNKQNKSFKTLLAVHEFASAGLVDIDLTTLNFPVSGYEGHLQPSATELQEAHITAIPDNVRLISSVNGVLTRNHFDIISPTLIRLKNMVSSLNEIIEIEITLVPISDLMAIEGRREPATGILLAGQTDIILNAPITCNASSASQIGEVILFIDGQQYFRCEGNELANDGDYIEVPPSSGVLTNVLRLKNTLGLDANYLALPACSYAYKPSLGMLAQIESLYPQIDVMVRDLAEATGNPVSRYQPAPNSIDLANFGEKVNSITSEVMATVTVGSNAQKLAGKVTHDDLQQAINDCPVDGTLLLLPSYVGSQNIAIDKRINFVGQGYGSKVNGTCSFGISFLFGTCKNINFRDNVIIGTGSNYNFIQQCFIASGKTVTDNGTGNQKMIIVG